MLKKLDKHTPHFISFLQSLFLSIYIFLIGSLMTNGEKLFNKFEEPSILAPMLFLTMFIFSAMVSATLVLGYPFYTFWVKKDLPRAAATLFGTGLFLLLNLVVFLLVLVA
jgi:uncharacterized membrane protein